MNNLENKKEEAVRANEEGRNESAGKEQATKSKATEESKLIFDDIARVEEDREESRVETSSRYLLHPDLSNMKFNAKPIIERAFGREAVMLAVKLHQNWVKKVELQEADGVYLQLLGMEKEYKASVGMLKSRKKKREGQEYLGVSIEVQGEVINAPFEIAEYKLLELLNFIKKKD